MSMSVLLPVLRVAMVCGGAACILIVVYSGSAASLAVRDWTMFRVLLLESVLIGYLSACTLDRFSSAAGTEQKSQAAAKALRYGLGVGMVLAIVLGAVLVYSNPDRALAALLAVVGGMLT